MHLRTGHKTHIRSADHLAVDPAGAEIGSPGRHNQDAIYKGGASASVVAAARGRNLPVNDDQITEGRQKRSQRNAFSRRKGSAARAQITRIQNHPGCGRGPAIAQGDRYTIQIDAADGQYVLTARM